ncbi:MAG: hypothetical protein WCR30_00150 [Clostridia bacterium]
MFECNIVTAKKNEESIKHIFLELKNKLKGLNSVISLFSNEFETSILIGSTDDCKASTILHLKRAIATCAVKNFKKDYINRRLVHSNVQDKRQSAFKKALSLFDDDCDTELVMEKVELSEKFYLNSFFEFSLSSLKSKWDRVCNLANENPVNELCEASFVSLIEFLVENTPYSTRKISIYPKGEKCKLQYDENEIEIKNDEVFEKMIELAPRQIVFNGVMKEFLNCSSLTCHVFENKIQYNIQKGIVCTKEISNQIIEQNS